MDTSPTPSLNISIENEMVAPSVCGLMLSTAAFSQGWRSIPDELKVKILSYVLITDDPIEHYDVAPNILATKRLSDNPNCFKDMLSLSIGAPETKIMAQEIFYGKNTFHLRLLNDYVYIPTSGVNDYIQNIVIFWGPRNRPVNGWIWGVLRDLSGGQYGFRSLQVVKIAFDLRDHPSNATEVRRVTPITFFLKRLTVEAIYWTDWEEEDLKAAIMDSVSLENHHQGMVRKES